MLASVKHHGGDYGRKQDGRRLGDEPRNPKSHLFENVLKFKENNCQ
jgi:hypothetical protein